MLTYGENLRNIRTALRIKTVDFAAHLNVQYRTYLSYERGERTIPAEMLEKLIKDFDVNINYIFTGEGEFFNTKDINPLQIPERNMDVECMKLDFGERVYLIQKFNGKTDKEMAEILSMSLTRYYEITNESKNLTLKECDAIKANFDISIDDILYDENGFFKILEKEMKKEKEAFESLTLEEREAFKKFLKSH